LGWRKIWQHDWEIVSYCSDRCRQKSTGVVVKKLNDASDWSLEMMSDKPKAAKLDTIHHVAITVSTFRKLLIGTSASLPAP